MLVLGKQSVKIELGEETELFFYELDNFMDLLLFSINGAAAAPHFLHVFHGGSGFDFLLVMNSYILLVPKTWRFLDKCSLVWLSFLTGCRSEWMKNTSLSARWDVCIAAELPPGCAQVRDLMVLGRNLNSSGRQLWSFSRQLQGFNTFPNSLPAAFCCHLCANIGQQDCWIGVCSSAWGTSVQILAVYPSPTLISFAHLKRLRCCFGSGNLL